MELLHNSHVEGLERVTSGLDEVEHSVHAVVDNSGTVNLVFNPQGTESKRWSMSSTIGFHESVLLTKSRKPGVSITVRCSRTPFSSISAVTWSMETVLGISVAGSLGVRGGYRGMLKRVEISVDSPDQTHLRP